MDELAKCPFCEGNGKVVGRKKYQVICRACGARTKKYDFRSEAIENWNKRSQITKADLAESKAIVR